MVQDYAYQTQARPLYVDGSTSWLFTTNPQTGQYVWVASQLTGRPIEQRDVYIHPETGFLYHVDPQTSQASWIVDPLTGQVFTESAIQAAPNAQAASTGFVDARQDLAASTWSQPAANASETDLAPSYVSEGLPASKLAVVAMALSILAFGTSFLPFVNNASIVLGIVALVFSVVGIIETRRSEKWGTGLCVGALVLGCAAIAIALVTNFIVSDPASTASAPDQSTTALPETSALSAPAGEVHDESSSASPEDDSNTAADEAGGEEGPHESASSTSASHHGTIAEHLGLDDYDDAEEALEEGADDEPADEEDGGEDAEEDESHASQAASDSAASDTAPASASTSSTMPIGRYADLESGLVVTVNAVRHGLTGDDGAPLAEVSVTYSNEGTKEAGFAPVDWQGADADGNVSDLVDFAAEGCLGEGTLAPGMKISGTIYFEEGITKLFYLGTSSNPGLNVSWNV